jgi:hypothetical protein
MKKFRVITIFTDGDGFVERRDKYETDSLVDAYKELGRKAPISNGVLLVDDQNCVWAKFEPKQLNQATTVEELKYQLYMDREPGA